MEDTTIDIREFVRELTGEWSLEQLLEYAQETLIAFYTKYEDTLMEDYKLFQEDASAHHVQGY